MVKDLRILVVDDDQRMAKTLIDIFKTKGYYAEAANSGTEALKMVKSALQDDGIPYHCVLTDIKMPGMSGVELHQATKAIDPELPVVFMTAYASDKTIANGLRDGALASLPKPLDINLILCFFSSLNKEPAIVVIDDDANFCRSLKGILQARGFQVKCITDADAIQDSSMTQRQIVLLDLKLDSISGIDVLKEIRKSHPRQQVVLVTGYRQEMGEAIRAGLEIGAYTCLYKPLVIDDLFKTLAEIRHKELRRTLKR